MLRLNKIVKVYKVADTNVEALKGLDLSFRSNEFVSILGPSGCGKTTLLNIIGGLDKYTSGDLFINGVSTKEYNDRDWDVYRNHRVGFVFQSYNLIPHQTILGNVELALTIAGISKQERIRRAKEAIDKVGLKGQYYKKPNQLSGGQCQRVAIARALVNEPEILLADEPTGALDTVTSVQIMDLIKEISKEKLVIMVTHNPDLAEKYSSRIVKMLDGNILSDSNPFTSEEEIAECEAARVLKENEINEFEALNQVSYVEAQEKAKMSFSTAFKLSFRNLLSKFKRTLMTVIAGSIGIVGVATVLAVSTGIKGYIKDMQDDMLSGNPIEVSEMTIDIEKMINNSSSQNKVQAVFKDGVVNVNSMIDYFLNNTEALETMLVQNAINQEYVDYIKSMPKEYYNAINLDYGIDITFNMYTDYKVNDNLEVTNTSLFNITNIYTAALEHTSYSKYASVITSLATVMQQGVSDNDYINLQYDVLEGHLPQNDNDVLVVLDGNSAMTDLLLAQLGYYTQSEFFHIVDEVTTKEENYVPKFKDSFTYEEILGKEFVWYPNDYVYTEKQTAIPNGVPFTYNHEASSKWEIDENSKDYTKGIKMNICGIVKPKENISYGSLQNGFIYTESLAKNIIDASLNSKAVKYMEENQTDFDSVKTPSYTSGFTYTFDYYYGENDVYTKNSKTECVGKMNQMAKFASMMPGLDQVANMAQVYSLSKRNIGGASLPSLIKVYPINFDQKHLVTNYLDDWNDLTKDITINVWDLAGNIIGERTIAKDDPLRVTVKYSDKVELIINMINTMIDIVTYALVAFTALSLVVSTVMVGIITYVSVVERTKEIGVIRSQGGRKKDVAHLFNAETFMIGLASGVFGITVTSLISFIINTIIKHLANVTVVDLTLGITVVMISISIVLNLISGMIPARAAARKNPVDALRSE